MKHTLATSLGNYLRDSASALMLRVGAFKQDAKDMQDEIDRKEISDTVPFVLIQDNLHVREVFVNLRALSESIGMDIEDAIDIIRHRNGIFGAFIIHEVEEDDESFAFR